MTTTRGRLVYSNQVVYDQADFFQLDGYTRVTGLLPPLLVSEIYYNNQLLPWPIVLGTGVTDAQVVSGKVYFQPLVLVGPSPYGVRFRPNAVGFWRLLIAYPIGVQILAQSFDVIAGTGVVAPSGIKASFVEPGGKGGC